MARRTDGEDLFANLKNDAGEMSEGPRPGLHRGQRHTACCGWVNLEVGPRTARRALLEKRKAMPEIVTGQPDTARLDEIRR